MQIRPIFVHLPILSVDIDNPIAFFKIIIILLTL
jgi:hypothetical protein